MENRPDSSNQKSPKLDLYLDPEILALVTDEDLLPFNLVPLNESRRALLKKGDRIWANFPDGNFCDFPLYQNNIKTLLENFRQSSAVHPQVSPFEALFKTGQSLEKKIFTSSARHLWDEVIKKINSISNDCHSLGSLVEKLLDVPFLQHFESSLIVLHLKGQTRATVIGTLWRGEKSQQLIEVKDFNLFFNSVKKSKIKSFTTDSFPKLNLPFNGHFLAKEVISKKYSLVAVASRNDFLSCTQDEIDLYSTCIDLLQPHFERLIDQEFSDKKISELRVCLKDFPLPVRIKDAQTGATFLNDLYHNELQDKDIFLSSNAYDTFTVDLYDSDELRHYAFDLFHFQRISLLGELLNTLRHELSNPLFGLKLGSQIFATLDVDAESKEMMAEIEKNINRCQLIIENFSSLYQAQSVEKAVTVHKILDEACVLAKSEARGHRVTVDYELGLRDRLIHVPLIFVVQIIFNLIVNACQSLRQNTHSGKISIMVTGSDKELRIDVSDNGPGIARENLDCLFKPFFTTKPQGTGLGLVLSRNLALNMGGDLQYIEQDGAGAQFRLTLPLK